MLVSCGNIVHLVAANYKSEFVTTVDGLVQTNVYCTYQDSKGFLWFGTRNGLCRYDGYNYATYQNDLNDPNSISGNIIIAIQEDSKGNLWIGTSNSGLNYFNRETGNFKRFRHDPKNTNSIGSDAIKSLMITSKDDLWISTFDNGLYHYRPGKSDFSNPYKYSDTTNFVIRNKSYGDFQIDKYDNVYFSYSTVDNSYIIKIINKTNKINVIRKLYSENLIPGLIISLDNSNNIYFYNGYRNGDRELFVINCNDGSVIRKIEFANGLLNGNYVYKMKMDRNNNLWLWVDLLNKKYYRQTDEFCGFYNLGQINNISKISTENYIFRSEIEPESVDYNFQILDKQGFVWINTYIGLKKFVPVSPGITNYAQNTSGNSISSNYIRSVIVDNSDNIYAGTDFGLNILKKGTSGWKNINLIKKGEYLKNKIKTLYQDENKINTLYMDKNSNILIGTNRGVQIYNPYSDDISEFDNSVFGVNRAVWSFYRDKEDNLWVGTMSGIYIFDKYYNLIRNYFTEQSGYNIKRYPIFLIYEDKSGNVWVGTEQGVLKWLPEQNSFKHYQHNAKDSNSICGSNIWSITEDLNGNLWFGAYGAGISKYDSKRDCFSSITKKDGLPDNGIGSILCDSLNNLWLGSEIGLIKYNQTKKSFRVYNTNDGFVNNAYGLNVYARCGDGSLLFGGQSGLTRFYPDSLEFNHNIPDIVITSFKINNREIHNELFDGDSVFIDWENKYFSFEFAVLDYRNPSQNQYAYKLQNLNNEWVNTGTDRNISFSNLDAGEYIFKVKGRNSQGVWNEKGISIYVSIIPPFYMTSWFRILVLVLLGSILLTIHFFRIKARRQKEQTKRRILVSQLKALQTQMNPHFIFNSLNAILNLILKNENELSIQYLNKFSRLLRDVLENSRNLSVSLKKEIEYLTLYLELESLRFENRFQYRITYDENLMPEQISVPTLLIQPYIENSIRHGIVQNVEKGKIDVNFSINSEFLFCDIIDNGIGRQKSKEIKAKSPFMHKSFGMEVNRERLELLKSKVDVIDLIDEAGNAIGTHIKLMFNLKTDLLDER